MGAVLIRLPKFIHKGGTVMEELLKEERKRVLEYMSTLSPDSDDYVSCARAFETLTEASVAEDKVLIEDFKTNASIDNERTDIRNKLIVSCVGVGVSALCFGLGLRFEEAGHTMCSAFVRGVANKLPFFAKR